MTTNTDDVKLIADYIHNDFDYCLNLDCYTFKQLLINAFVEKMRKTKEGQDYLEECYMLTQTNMDVGGIKRLISKE